MNARTLRYLTAALVVAFCISVRAQEPGLRSGLRTAALEGNVAAVRQLVAQGADPNDGCPITAAIRRDHVDAVLALIELGSKVDCKGGPDAAPDRTPLNMAITFPRVHS